MKIRILICLSVLGAVALLWWNWYQTRSQYLHLYVLGGWGIDTAIWVYPDDSYRVQHISSRPDPTNIDETGHQANLFQEIVAIADARNAWQITTASLADEVAALNPEGRNLGIFDGSHDFLEFRLHDRTLTADFYATRQFIDSLPDAQQLRTFEALTKAFSQNKLSESTRHPTLPLSTKLLVMAGITGLFALAAFIWRNSLPWAKMRTGFLNASR